MRVYVHNKKLASQFIAQQMRAYSLFVSLKFTQSLKIRESFDLSKQNEGNSQFCSKHKEEERETFNGKHLAI